MLFGTFLALFFEPSLFLLDVVPTLVIAFLATCLVASSNYVLNEVLDAPLHPYTLGLIGSVPSRNSRGKRLMQIPGMTPSLLLLPAGCPFQARCSRASAACVEEPEEREIRPGHLVRCHHPHLAEVPA